MARRLRHACATAAVAAALTVLSIPPPALAATHAPAPPPGTVIHGAARLADGDTLDLASPDGNSYRVRLWGVDAPETKQSCRRGDAAEYDCGAAATAGLETALGDLANVTCTVKATDQYGRAVATCSGPSGVDAGGTLVKQGLAVELKQYSKGAYTSDEAAAKAAKAGVWAGPFLEPAEWRREARIANLEAVAARAAAAPAGAPRPKVVEAPRPDTDANAPSPSPPCDIKGNISTRGLKIYYMPGHRLYDSVKINRPGERMFCSAAEAEEAGWRAPAD